MPIQPVQSVRHGWRNVLPAAAPGCSQGTPYSFWAKEGDPKKLAVILAGGGACWTGENCALHGRPHYRAFAGLELDPTNLGGVFDTDNVENPLADYTLIYLPTANGDVFLGDATPVYDTPAMNDHPEGKLTILHKGFDNAMAALDWMFRTYKQPNTVAVMGWSAGALASPLYTHIVAQQYPGAQVTHFADGGGAYHLSEKLAPLFKSWGTEKILKRVEGFEDLPIDGLTIEDLYIRAAKLHPDIVFHQYNERHDAVQAMFMQLIGEKRPDVPAKLDQAHAYIRAKIPNFRTYTSWGHDEAIIGGYYDAVLAKNALDNRGRPHVLDRFYTRQANGVRFLDWFTAAVTGKPVEDVACVDSETPEYHWTRPAFPQ
jgi:Pectinacetylesterase